MQIARGRQRKKEKEIVLKKTHRNRTNIAEKTRFCPNKEANNIISPEYNCRILTWCHIKKIEFFKLLE